MKTTSKPETVRRPFRASFILSAFLAVFAVLPARAFVPAGHDARTVAFYPFTGYASGTRWTVPAGEEATYTSTAYNKADVSFLTNHVVGADMDCAVRLYVRASGYVTVTNETPGKYLFANKSAKWPLVSDYMSIRAVPADSQFTTIDFPSFGKMMAAKAESTGAFTLELFLKPNENCYGSALFFGVSAKNTVVEIPQNATNNKLVRMSGDGNVASKTLAADVRDSNWHHVAVVYSQPDRTANGTASLYYDYELVGSIELSRDTAANGALRLCASKTWPGLFSALRVSDAALEPDGFMRVSDDIRGAGCADDVIGFYPLDDKADGFSFGADNCDADTATARDSVWSDAFSNVAESTGYHCSTTGVRLVVRHEAGTSPNVAFFSTNDVPARYVFNGIDAVMPLRELETSLCELGPTMAGSPNTSDWLGLFGLPADIQNADGFTLEFFAKFHSVPGTFCFFDQGNSGWNRVVLQKNSDNGLQATFLYQADADSASRTSYSRMTYPDLDTLADGRWHHVAIVCDGSKMRLFADYTIRGDEIGFVKGTAIGYNYEFRLGNGQAWALFSCLRATARALDPSEFLYASDNAGGVLADADWGWRLDGTPGEALSEATADVTAAMLDETQYLFKDAHGFTGIPSGSGSLAFAKPFFPGMRFEGGVETSKNRAATAVSEAFLATSPSGPLCAPGLVFTAEALVSATAPASGAATVFGAEDAVGNPAWSLAVDSTGALVLAYAMQDASAATNTVMTGFAGSPHHVALAADIANRSLSVYVDYSAELSLSPSDITKPLSVDGVRFVVAGGCGGATLSGAIDEVRLSHSILPPAGFLRVKATGTTLILR